MEKYVVKGLFTPKKPQLTILVGEHTIPTKKEQPRVVYVMGGSSIEKLYLTYTKDKARVYEVKEQADFVCDCLNREVFQEGTLVCEVEKV